MSAFVANKALGVIAITAVLAGCGPVTGGLAARGTPTAPRTAGPASGGAASGHDPQLAGTPHVAVMPQHRTGATSSPSTASPAAQPTNLGPASAQSSRPPSSASSSGSGSGSATCVHPKYVTSDPNGMWNLSPYFVANDMWNVNGYNVSQTLYGCSYSDWYVTATMDNSKGDGAVKTFPNSHRDFDSLPRISSFKSITSTFADSGPSSGTYEDAYDIWLNGIGGSDATEVMIWTNNHGQTPAGSAQGTVTIDGRPYSVWKTTGNYIAFVASANFTSGSMDLLAFFKWLMSKGWVSNSATLGQVDYGVELVSTNGVPATFTFSNFSVNAS